MRGHSKLPPRLLRLFARWIVRGTDSPYILGDLDEGWMRDRSRGHSPMRASVRFAGNALQSAVIVALRRLPAGLRGGSWLDVKLGFRMVRRQPSMTAVSLFALGIGIPLAMVPGQLERALTADLPFDEGEDIVGIRTVHVQSGRSWTRTLHDFELWRRELDSFNSLGAWDAAHYNVSVEGGWAGPVSGAAITASAFEITRVPPLLGRVLLPSDERPGAPAVVVLGHSLWRSAFGSDLDVIGRVVRVSGIPHEVVGIMPEGYLFPNNERLWIPFRARGIDHPVGEGPTIEVFGRLADGVTRAQANAEVGRLAARLATDSPATHGRLRPEVVGYAQLTYFGDPLFAIVKVVGLLLLVIACGNVGLLILARTAMRTSEIAVRTALGAGRGRIVVQVFVETLVTALLAVSIGLLLADGVAALGHRTLGDQLPFWLDLGVTWETVLVALALGALSAVIAGVIPALKATAGEVHTYLKDGGRGASSMRFGAFSTALVVAEVALAVWFFTMGSPLIPSAIGAFGHGAGVDPDEYLMANVWYPGARPGLDGLAVDSARLRQRIAQAHQEIVRTLGREAVFGGSAMGSVVPGTSHSGQWIEVEGLPRLDDTPAHWVRTATVVPGFFEQLGQQAVAGRTFRPLDGEQADSTPVIVVNTQLVAQVLGGRNAVGRRIRRVDRGGSNPGEWLEIVGVVPRLGMFVPDPRLDAGYYRPAAPGELNPIQMAVQVNGDPVAFAGRLREVVAAVDPELQVTTAGSMTHVISTTRSDGRWGLLLFGAIASVAIVLSAAGLYALVGFTVSRRTREIGIRTALGASKGRIAWGVAMRALLQLCAGVALGALLALLITPRMYNGPGMIHVQWSQLVSIVAAGVFAIGLLACVPPILRSLRITPMEALVE